MIPHHQLSVLPEFHIIDEGLRAESSSITNRSDSKKKVFISFRGDDSRLEWRISQSHEGSASVCRLLRDWSTSTKLNVSIAVSAAPGCASVPSSDQVEMMDLVVAKSFSGEEGLIVASACEISGESLDDLLSHGAFTTNEPNRLEPEVVPELVSVCIKSMLDYQKFVRRIEQSVSANASLVIVRFVLFESSRIIHFIFAKPETLIKDVAVVSSVRAIRKYRQPIPSGLSLAQRCLIPIMAGNAKPYFVVPIGPIEESNATLYQGLFDAGEKLCLTALPCVPEGDGLPLKIRDFDIIDSIDVLPIRKAKVSSIPSVDSSMSSLEISQESVIKSDLLNLDMALHAVQTFEVPRSPVMESDEVTELKSKNLALRCEIDKLKTSGSVGNTTAYTNHLLSEVKQLRQELLAVETERRKYLTSKRLVESLMEKSNKTRDDLHAKSVKIDELKKSEKAVREELHAVQKDCQTLVARNKELEAEIERLKNAAKAEAENKPTVDSLYHQFLFPFNSKRDWGKQIVALAELMIKLERNCAINNPSAVLDIRKAAATVESIKDRANELIGASEKLEISCMTLLKRRAETGKPMSKKNNS